MSYEPITISYSINGTPKPPSPEQSLAKELEELAKEKPENAQIMKRVAEKAENEYKQRVEKALAGSAELELIKGPQSKRFVLKHFFGGKEYTVYGTAYPGYDADEETTKTFTNSTIYMQADRHPCVYNSYGAMVSLKKHLKQQDAPYVIKFFD